MRGERARQTVTSRSSTAIPLLPRLCQRIGGSRGAARGAIGQSVQAEDLGAAAEGNQVHVLGFSRLEANGGAGRNVEMHAECLFTLEVQRLVHFEEMEMAAHLDRAIAGIHRPHSRLRASGIELDVSVAGD